VLAERGGIGVAEGFPIEDDCGGEAAGADAARGGERGVRVRSGFAGTNAQGFLGGGQERGRTFNVARGAQANEAAVLAGRLESEEVIEGGDAVSLAGGNAERFGDKADRRLVEKAERFLNGVESFDEGVARKAVTPHGAIDDTPTLIVRGERGLFQG